jgi:hypothetical protein
VRHTVIAACLLALAAGCSSDSEPSTAKPIAPATTAEKQEAPAAQPKTVEAVRAAADEEFESFASRDYGGSWDLWTKAGQKAITRADYEQLLKLCPDTGAGVAFQIKKVKLAADGNSALVRVQRLAGIASFTFLHEGGEWRFQPLEAALADYKLGSPKAIAAKARKAGRCG